MNAIERKISSLADLTWHLGCLHEFQTTQLKMWPQVMLNAKSSESEYNHESRTVTISVSDCEPIPDDPEERMKFLGESVQMLLGKDITVFIKGNQPQLNTEVWPKIPLRKKSTTST